MDISDIFYVVVFLSIIGSMACVLLLFIERVTRLCLPLKVYMSIIFFYVFPVTIPDAALFYHEPMRMETFKTAALVWIIGLCVLAVFMILRIFFVHRMINKFTACTAENVLVAYDECLRKLNLRRAPPLMFGMLKEPACVITTWRSYVVLQEKIIKDLTDDELKAVLVHELLHIKRKHGVLQRVFDLVCCVHWFNPLIWVGRRGFSSACEIDCDRSVLKVFDGNLQAAV